MLLSATNTGHILKFITIITTIKAIVDTTVNSTITRQLDKFYFISETRSNPYNTSFNRPQPSGLNVNKTL